MGQLSGLPFLSGVGAPSGADSFEILKAHLQKKEHIWKVIEHFDLKKHYEIEPQYLDKRYYRESLEMKSPVETAYLDSLVMSKDQKSSIVNLSFSDKDPHLATDVANYNVELLREISLQTATTENRRKREFLEERLAEARQELTEIEEEMKNYMQEHRILSVQSQADATIGVVSKIQSEILLNQLKIKVKTQLGANENHPEIKMLSLENDALQKQLKAIEGGTLILDQSMINEEERAKGLTYLPVAKIPQLQLDIARITRELAVRQEVFKALSKEYEMAKIESAKDQEFVEVIEQAVLPERKDKPRRSLICVVATMSGFLLACFSMLVLDALRKRKAVVAGSCCTAAS
jgi:uncharacterized protein involved in exopolysaccharide biosynthesis